MLYILHLLRSYSKRRGFHVILIVMTLFDVFDGQTDLVRPEFILLKDSVPLIVVVVVVVIEVIHFQI